MYYYIQFFEDFFGNMGYFHGIIAYDTPVFTYNRKKAKRFNSYNEALEFKQSMLMNDCQIKGQYNKKWK